MEMEKEVCKKYFVKSPLANVYEMNLSKTINIESIILKVRDIESPHIKDDLYLKNIKALSRHVILDKKKQLKYYPIIDISETIQITFDDSALNSNFNLLTFTSVCPLTNTSISNQSSVHDNCGFVFEKTALEDWKVNNFNSKILCPICKKNLKSKKTSKSNLK